MNGGRAATSILALLGLAATVAGFWLAITSQWAGAAGCAVVTLVAALTMLVFSDPDGDVTDMDDVAPWTSKDVPPDEHPTFALRDTGKRGA